MARLSASLSQLDENCSGLNNKSPKKPVLGQTILEIETHSLKTIHYIFKNKGEKIIV